MAKSAALSNDFVQTYSKESLNCIEKDNHDIWLSGGTLTFDLAWHNVRYINRGCKCWSWGTVHMLHYNYPLPPKL
jgi:hypothetical protein